MKQAPSPPLPQERWYNIKEVALQLNRSRDRIHTLIREYELPRRKVREGQHPRLIIEVSYDTLQVLRRITRR